MSVTFETESPSLTLTVNGHQCIYCHLTFGTGGEVSSHVASKSNISKYLKSCCLGLAIFLVCDRKMFLVCILQH